MNKIFTVITFLVFSHFFSQTTVFGGVAGLSFRKNNIKDSIVPTDTLTDRLMNYHLVKDPVHGTFFKKVDGNLNQPSLFFVSNKFGGTNKKVYGKIGSSIISSLGIDDFSDTLRINSPQLSSKILTFTKTDMDNKINPIVLLNKKTDPMLLIPEVLVFDNNLSTLDKQKIETYLSVKYGITINDISENNYVSSAGDILWDSKKNKNYNLRITGLGRDDAFGLYQKQSKNSEDEHIIMSLNTLKATNYQNPETLNPGTFLLWGDNNQSLSFKEADLLSAHPKRDMFRMWKAQIKNSAVQPVKTHVYLSLAGLSPSDKVLLRLFANESNYQNDISTDILGEKIGDKYVFKDIMWDIDHNGTEYFTFNLQDSQSELNIQMVSTCSDLGSGIVKISVPADLFPFTYSLISLSSNQTVVTPTSGSTNPIVFNNLLPDNYKLIIQKPGQSNIVRTFDLEGIANQNINDHYVWQGSPIELDLNTESYQYVLTSPAGQTSSTAPFLLNGTGNYQLKIKNKLNCEVNKSLSVLSQADYDALQSTSLFKKISVSPNPSHDGNLTVKVELKSIKPLTVKIFNSLGVLVKQGQYGPASDFNIPMNIPAVVGYYNIKIFIPEEGKGVNFLIN
ncbi:hypothetical protein [uncultured Chryseobacterium sp.]|uniref:hypothetical protein n=1 Tax=uncultured Chryseobacterium sp. TaxID=259322 RepID=UPI0025FD34DF|nr:hypothetical protein [uncultured Chryseobacterium sp.]